MTTNLPDTIAAYFRAKNEHNTATMAALFAKDAIVHDEGQKFRGIAAIEDWIVRTTAKYQVTVDVTNSTLGEGETIVTGRVRGNFPGSPIELQFRFTLEGEKIASLII